MAAAATSPSQATGSGLELVPVRSRSTIVPLAIRPGRQTLGSDPSCDLCINIDGVAPQHCLIISGPQKTIIKALSPLTWINDGPVGESALRPGDRLIVGPIELVTKLTCPQGAGTPATQSNPQEAERALSTPRSGRSSAGPVPPPLPPLPPLADVAKLLRSTDDSLPPPLPLGTFAPAVPVPPPSAAVRRLLRGESTFETPAVGADLPATSTAGGRPISGGDSEQTVAVAERERALQSQSEELLRVRRQLEEERAALAERETRLKGLEQERRLLARQLEEMELRADREQTLAADLERERSAVAALRAELDEARCARAVEESNENRRLEREEELEGLRREVEALTKKLASSRLPSVETDRNSLLQQRTELLAIRREAQEKLAEQQRMTAELEQARQALQQEAEDFRRQQIAAEEEFARVERRMTDLESREAALLERERAAQGEFDRISGLQESLANQSASIDQRAAALQAVQAGLEEERARCAAVQVEAEDVRRRQAELATRESELGQVAAQLEEEMRRIEQSADRHRADEQELESKRRDLEERARSLQADAERLEQRQRDLAESEGRVRKAEADLDLRRADLDERQQAHEAAKLELSHRIQESEEQAARLEERFTELAVREREVHDLQESLQAARQFDHSNAAEALATLEQGHETATSIEEDEQKSEELNRLREEIEERERRVSERERAMEEHMRVIVLADAERAHWTREHDRLASQIAEMEERVEEWRLQEAALAECRVFVTSRERAIEARLIDLERREARLSEKEAALASLEASSELRPAAPETVQSFEGPAADPGDTVLDRELEAARLNAESLAQRARELEQKLDALGQRETALNDLAATLRRREAELDEREETLAATAVSSPLPAASSAASIDVEELSRFEEDLRQKSAAIDAEREEIDQLRSELSQHRDAFLEQFRSLEQERAEFYADQQALSEEASRLEEERTAFLLERKAFDEERLLSEVPLEQDGLPQWDGAPADRTVAQIPPFPSLSDVASVPADDPGTSIHDEAPTSVWPTAGHATRSPYSMAEPESDRDGEREPAAMENAPSPEGLQTALLEMEPEPDPQPERPEVQSSDALELRAHLADLFGIDLSRRRASEPPSARPQIDDVPMDEPIEPEPEPKSRMTDDPVEPSETLPDRSDSHEDVDVATYMERLLARSRNSMSGGPAPVAPASPLPVPRPELTVTQVSAPEVSDVPEAVPEVDEEEPARPARRPLQQQERDAIRGSMDSFRELANRTARAAVARHQLVKLRNTLSTKAMLAGFCGLVTVILVVPEFWGSDRYRLPAMACVCVTVIAVLEWLRTKVRIKKLDDFVAESDISKELSADEGTDASPEA